VNRERQHINNQYLLSFQHGEEEGFDYFFRRYYKTLNFFAKSLRNSTSMRQEQQIIDLLCTGAPLNIGGSFSSLSNDEMSPVHVCIGQSFTLKPYSFG
jgi:hypothetical protein